MSAIPQKRTDAARLYALALRLIRERDARNVRTDGWQRIDEVLVRVFAELDNLQQRRDREAP